MAPEQNSGRNELGAQTDQPWFRHETIQGLNVRTHFLTAEWQSGRVSKQLLSSVWNKYWNGKFYGRGDTEESDRVGPA